MLDLAPWRRRAWPGPAASQAHSGLCGGSFAGNASAWPQKPWGGCGGGGEGGAGGLSVAALMGWFARLPRRHSQRLLLIKGGRLAVLPLKPPGDTGQVWGKGR
jgi:hypothetical protein